jgi:capsule polysaccharide modification protein KpsS
VLAELAGRRVLLLQGPAGPFFKRVARHLGRLGCEVTKVNFNSGDDLFYRRPGVVRYRGTREEWPRFLRDLLDARRASAVVLFGDCRPLHRAAIEVLAAAGVDVYVFEEGYLRPDFVTFEKGGVNGFSSVPKDAGFYRRIRTRKLAEPRPVRHAFLNAALFTVAYACAQAALRFRYPHYRHHRDIRPFYQGGLWFRSGVRRVLCTLRDRKLNRRLERGEMPPYFFVPLQVSLDSQMQHCPFPTIEVFIEHVVRSFARHAPRDTVLVFKHHPFDRAYRDYGAWIAKLASELGLGQRLIYADAIHIPAALKGALGTVVMNSTVGVSSMHHGTPVMCLGTAVYDIVGLTHPGPLDEFWKAPGKVDRDLFERFRYFLRTTNQINGSVWTDLLLPDAGTLAGSAPSAAGAAEERVCLSERPPAE